MEEQSSYFLTLTSKIVDDERLSNFEKLLYARITGLTRETGYCYATNKYFAEKCHVTERNIQRAIRNLKECGYIDIHVEYRNKTKEVVQRYICLTETLCKV